MKNYAWILDYEREEFNQFIMKLRPATVDEAVDSILRCILKETRVQQLAWFKEKHGEEFAKQVELLVRKKFKGKTK